MLAVVSAYLKHNQKKYYFTDSVLCNISSKKEGHKYAEELECTLIDNMLSAGLYASMTSIRSIDTDLDCIMVDFQNSFEDVIENLINAKVYSSKKSLEDDIKDGNLQLHAEAQYIDISKCIPWYSRTSAQKSFRSHKEYYENCASAIAYCIEYPSGIRRRFEVYGDMTWENSWEYRYELSDYDHIHERYKFGDIVKFKHPICGYSEGIITSIAEPKIGTGDICISRLYDVFCGKNALISCDSFEAIHHDDIEAVIGNDKISARRAVKERFPQTYTEKYRKEVDFL